MLTIHGLTRRYVTGAETLTVLNSVSATFRPGRLTVVAGPSGSGKTTLLTILGGFQPADEGTVTLAEGGPVGTATWQDIAFMPQSLAVLEELTVRENVDLPASLMPQASDWPSDDLMERLEIAHLADRLPSQISGGERQRTALARALRLCPKVLLADEPTGHQDAERIKLVTGLLHTHARYGNVVIVTSHDEDVMAAADDLYEITAGNLLKASTAPRAAG